MELIKNSKDKRAKKLCKSKVNKIHDLWRDYEETSENNIRVVINDIIVPIIC
jgi:hypothetical protein